MLLLLLLELQVDLAECKLWDDHFLARLGLPRWILLLLLVLAWSALGPLDYLSVVLFGEHGLLRATAITRV